VLSARTLTAIHYATGYCYCCAGALKWSTSADMQTLHFDTDSPSPLVGQCPTDMDFVNAVELGLVSSLQLVSALRRRFISTLAAAAWTRTNWRGVPIAGVRRSSIYRMTD
jgi:hypothetical protein